MTADPIGSIASGTPENVLANLLSSALIHAGVRVWTYIHGAGSKGEELQGAAAALMSPQTSMPSDVRLASLLPHGISAREVAVRLDCWEGKALFEQYAASCLIGLQTESRGEFCKKAAALVQPDPSKTGALDALVQALAAGVEESASLAIHAGDTATHPVATSTLARVILLQKSVDALKINTTRAPSRSFDEWLAAYRAQCVEAHGFITPPDYRERSKVQAADIYVPARIRDEKASADSPATVIDLIEQMDRNVLLGNPGGGKSTASERVVSLLATRPGARVPFLVVLRDYEPQSTSMSVVQYIESQLSTFYQCPPQSGAVENLLLTGSAVVVFDGLDELLETHRRTEITKRVELFSTSYPNCQILVTSREVGYAEARLDPQQFRTHVIANFTEDDVEVYVRKWFALQDFPIEEQELLASAFIEDSASVSDLRGNPLLLALMCIIYRGQRYLPKNRTGVYEACSRLLFETWDKSRGIDAQVEFELYLEAALKHLAYWMFEHPDTKNGVPESQLVEEVANFLQGRIYESPWEAQSAARNFVAFCKGRAWVLSDAGTTANDEPLYKFTHQTFMEYFAASHLTRKFAKPERIAKVLFRRVLHAEWDVVGQLAIHLEDQRIESGGELILRYLLKRAAKLEERRGRENVLAFCCRSVEYLAVPPKLLRELTAATVAVVVEQAADPEPSVAVFSDGESWRILSTIDQAGSPVILNEFEKQAGMLLDSDSPIERKAGLHLALEMGTSHFQGRVPRARLQALVEMGQTTLLGKKDQILGWNSIPHYWAQQLLFRNIFDFEQFYNRTRGSRTFPLDSLFQSPQHPIYKHLHLVSCALVLFDTIAPRADRQLSPKDVTLATEMLDGVGKVLAVGSENRPLVRRSAVDIDSPFGYGSGAEILESSLSAERLAVAVVLVLLMVEATGADLQSGSYGGPGGRSSIMSLLRSRDGSGAPVAELARLVGGTSPDVSRYINASLNGFQYVVGEPD